MRIALFCYEGMTTLDLIGPHDVLARIPEVEVVSVSKDGTTVTADTGALGITPTHRFDQIDAADVVVVPGGLEGTFAAMADEDTLAWLRTIAESATWITSVCTGSLILGAAGLLDGKAATSHWAAVDSLADMGATPTRERVVIDGNTITGAGVSAGIDMALTLVARLTDEATASAIQLGIEYDPQPPFQSGNALTADPELVKAALGSMS